MTRQRRPKHLPALLWTSLCLFAGRSAAELRYQYASATCKNETVPGQAVVCCSGDCLDGTTIFDQGLCRNVFDACLDPGTPLSCASSQVFALTASESVDAGLGLCYLPVTGCIWSYTKYTYSCCDCPAGFVPVASACTDRSRSFSDRCVGCSQPDEKIAFDAATQAFVCNGPSLVCRAAQAASTAVTALSLLTTWAGALCPVTTPKEMFASLLGSIDAVMQAITKPSNGVLGTKFNAASSVIVAFNTLALGLALIAGAGVELPVALAALPVLFTRFCSSVGSASAVLFIGGKAVELLDALNCPPSPSAPKKQRSVSLEPAPVAFRASPARRDGGLFNPCAEFVALFPDDSGSVAATVGACNDVASYDAASIDDPDVADAISTLQQACASLQDSNQLSVMQDLVILLSALEAAIPYCDVDPASSSSAAVSSALPSDSGVPTSIPPSSSLAPSSAPPSSSRYPSSAPPSNSGVPPSIPPSSSVAPSAPPSSSAASSGAPPSDSATPSSIPPSSPASSSAPPSSSAAPFSVPPSESGAPSSIPPSSSSSSAPSSDSATPSSAVPSASQGVFSSFSPSAAASSSTTSAASTSTALSSPPPQSTTSRTGGCHRKAELRKRRQH
ncbi:hypothetical protein MFIFM68171_11331 [Madurella fahalii]|uniref:Uncharacterized protein n=1 Tax=Madurella fahalii TaxID=1157608 RepID=A0ABQ0GTQ9_9PEZI